jgi:hypothetical protein
LEKGNEKTKKEEGEEKKKQKGRKWEIKVDKKPKNNISFYVVSTYALFGKASLHSIDYVSLYHFKEDCAPYT